VLHIKSVKYVSEYKLWLSFDNGSSGQVDLKGQLEGAVFDPLEDPAYFSRVSVDPELETVVWPNGADLAPEFLMNLMIEQSNGSVNRHRYNV